MKYEWVGILALVLLALLLWGYRIGDFPPGLHYDEAIDLWGGLQIQSGHYFMYMERGWGREGLYYYLLALVLSFIPNNLLALKLTAAGCSLGVMLSLYWLARRHTNPVVAWFAAAWYGVVYWSMFLSRSGNRAVLLPLMLNLAICTFWWAWGTASGTPKLRRYGYAGVVWGATMYTYQPARFTPFLFAAFFVYIALLHHDRLRTEWKGFVIFCVVACLLAMPLGVFLLRNPGPEGQRDWTIEPYARMMRGDFGPVLQNALATLKMFTVQGDPLVSYNVPGRPVFMPAWTGVFFYAGLALVLWRWRQPYYAFILIWLGVMFAPTILTISAPNHLRAAAALPPVVFMAALALGELIVWGNVRWGRITAFAGIAFGFLALISVGYRTWNDYFYVWPTSKQGDWSRNYNVHITSIAKYLRQHWDTRPVAISSHSIEDIHPTLVDTILDQEDAVFRWVDTTQALVIPAHSQQLRLFVAAGRWIDADLSRYAHLSDMPASYESHFSLLDVDFTDLVWPTSDSKGTVIPPHVPFPEDVNALTWHNLPANFDANVQLDAVDALPAAISPGETLTFFTAWEVLRREKGRALAMFVHVLDADGHLVAQQDGLGYPLVSWQPGDRFVHVHHIHIGDNVPSGVYWIQLGIYERSDGRRWPVQLDDAFGDRLLIGSINVQ